MGVSGSGKTTLLSCLNGLLKPDKGEVRLDEIALFSRNIKMELVRQRIGLLFQFPEWQLFEPTVAEDVAFGLMQMGISLEEKEKRVREALKMVGMSPETYMDRDPFELSGGEMRRVALAGILVMQPEILVLDEPTIGLDATVRKEFISLLSVLRNEHGISLVIASHNLEELFKLVDRVLVLEDGKVFFDGSSSLLLEWDEVKLKSAGLLLPVFSKLLRQLKIHIPDITTNLTHLEDVREEIIKQWRPQVKPNV